MAKANTDLAREFEGCYLSAYRDPVGIWTIGWGHTGPEVVAGLVWTQAQADEHLRADFASFEAGVERLLQHPATQGQFDAMVDLAYNIGLGAFGNSTVLKCFNSGDLLGSARAFCLWSKAGGQYLEGLIQRRAAETVRFLEQNVTYRG